MRPITFFQFPAIDKLCDRQSADRNDRAAALGFGFHHPSRKSNCESHPAPEHDRRRSKFFPGNIGRLPRNKSSSERRLHSFRKILRTSGIAFCRQCAQMAFAKQVLEGRGLVQRVSRRSRLRRLRQASIACAGNAGIAEDQRHGHRVGFECVIGRPLEMVSAEKSRRASSTRC